VAIHGFATRGYINTMRAWPLRLTFIGACFGAAFSWRDSLSTQRTWVTHVTFRSLLCQDYLSTLHIPFVWGHILCVGETHHEETKQTRLLLPEPEMAVEFQWVITATRVLIHVFNNLQTMYTPMDFGACVSPTLWLADSSVGKIQGSGGSASLGACSELQFRTDLKLNCDKQALRAACL